MNYFPHPAPHRPIRSALKSLAPLRQTLTRDVLWNRPLFKAPALPNPQVEFEPLPFTATRLTGLSTCRRGR